SADNLFPETSTDSQPMTVPPDTMLDMVPPYTMTDDEPPYTDDSYPPSTEDITDGSFPPTLDSTSDQSLPTLTEDTNAYSTDYPSTEGAGTESSDTLTANENTDITDKMLQGLNQLLFQRVFL
ncbi:hypothetical protein HDU76_011833, partial [Blyttiomyces sp. JEL0837]